MTDKLTDKPKPIEPPYEISAIRRAEAPSGTDGSNWHQYVISFEGNDSIQGFKSGTQAAVKISIEEMVAQLNERHLGKRGRVNLVPTPKKTARKT